MKQQGFSLVECMVYCMVLAILFMVIFNGVVYSYVRFAHAGKKTMKLSNIHAACDLLIRDLRQAPFDCAKWKKISDELIVWNTPDVDIGWTAKNNRLVRIKGNYNIKEQKWHTKKTSVAAFDVKQIMYKITKERGVISAISISLTINNDKTIEIQVALRNRKIYA